MNNKNPIYIVQTNFSVQILQTNLSEHSNMINILYSKIISDDLLDFIKHEDKDFLFLVGLINKIIIYDFSLYKEDNKEYKLHYELCKNTFYI